MNSMVNWKLSNNRTDSSYDSELSNILQEATGLHIWDILENR